MRQDWEKIETDYMANNLTYVEIAEKYGVSPSTVRRQGAKRQWVKKRAQFATKVQHKARQRTAEKKASREAELYGRVVKLAEELVGQLEGALSDDKQLYRHILGAGAGVQKEKVLRKLDTGAAKDYAGMLMQLGRMMADYSGMMTKKDAETLKMAREKLRLEKAKAEAEQRSGGETVEITFGGAGTEEADGDAARAAPAGTWEDFSE